MKNINLFGIEVDVPDPPRGRKRAPTMQEMYGITTGHTCRECVHRFDNVRSRTYHKCALWLELCFPNGGHSEASDIRLKDQACGKWEIDEDFEEAP